MFGFCLTALFFHSYSNSGRLPKSKVLQRWSKNLPRPHPLQRHDS